MLFCTSTRRAEHKADVGLVLKQLAGLVLRSKLLSSRIVDFNYL